MHAQALLFNPGACEPSVTAPSRRHASLIQHQVRSRQQTTQQEGRIKYKRQSCVYVPNRYLTSIAQPPRDSAPMLDRVDAAPFSAPVWNCLPHPRPLDSNLAGNLDVFPGTRVSPPASSSFDRPAPNSTAWARYCRTKTAAHLLHTPLPLFCKIRTCWLSGARTRLCMPPPKKVELPFETVKKTFHFHRRRRFDFPTPNTHRYPVSCGGKHLAPAF